MDVCFKLCCKGAMPNIWIPLDDSINAGIWENKFFDEDLECWRLDYETQLYYLIIEHF